MKLEDAKVIAEGVIADIAGECSETCIVGSVRRKCPEVHDVDIVAIPKVGSNLFYVNGVPKKILKWQREGINVEIYYATPQTYEVMRLIRTGSKEHNIKLCKAAKERGWKLKADGTGLINSEGEITSMIIDNTERGILEKLLGRYVEPEDRA